MTAPGPVVRDAAAPARGRRPDESMTLLREVTERPLDPGYAQMAQRRAEAGQAESRRAVPSLVALLLVAVLLGAATTVAVRSCERRSRRWPRAGRC
ncbi:hypothetical protein [Promicromonospora soli]